jgi:dTDP-4-dehydrorhamnose reductase
MLVYFSSEYVFDGKLGPYAEADVCNPLNEYGRQKLECERMIAAQLDRHLIGRVSGVYDWEGEGKGKNFVIRLIQCLSSGQQLRVPCDQMITPTYAPDLARVMRALVENGQQGLFHLSGSQPLLRTEFAHIVAEIFGLDARLIMPIATEELGLFAPRPRSAGLRIDKTQALLSFPIAGPREGLEAMKKDRELHLAVGRVTVGKSQTNNFQGDW